MIRIARTAVALTALLFLTKGAAAGCLPFSEAKNHVGANKCITGKVLKVRRTESGAMFLNFCSDYRTCSFQVVVFRGDLKHVGDVRLLEGRVVEIQGDIKEYDGRPEIILRDARQLRGEAARIPPLPKDFDVERKGRYSAGKFGHPKSSHTPAKRQDKRGIDDPFEGGDD